MTQELFALTPPNCIACFRCWLLTRIMTRLVMRYERDDPRHRLAVAEARLPRHKTRVRTRDATIDDLRRRLDTGDAAAR